MKSLGSKRLTWSSGWMRCCEALTRMFFARFAYFKVFKVSS